MIADPSEAFARFGECGPCTDVLYTNHNATCQQCGVSVPVLEHVRSSTSYNNPVAINNSSVYRRESHFRERLLIAQNICKQMPTKEEVHRIGLRLALYELPCDIGSLRVVVKQLRLSRLYQSLPAVHSAMTGKHTPPMPPKLVDHIMDLFQRAQASYDRHRPPGRKNFLSYTYTAIKLMQLAGATCPQWFANVQSLSGAHKNQSQIWKLICRDLSWPFIEHDGPLLELQSA